jgi:hypothetical protein
MTSYWIDLQHCKTILVKGGNVPPLLREQERC